MKKGLTAFICLFLALMLLVTSVPGAAAGLSKNEPAGSNSLPSPKIYIVLLTDPPLAAYKGGAQGIPATSPQVTGESQLDANSISSLQYKSYLAKKQAALLTTLSLELNRTVESLYQYRTTLNGLAVSLSKAEAEHTARVEGVRAVILDRWNFPTTDSTPAFIGATSIWNGTSTGGLPGAQGEGIIVGVIDTGIWPEHPSFADDGTYANPPASWKGFCQKPDDGTTWLICKNKLIGAQHFLSGYIAALGHYDGLFNSARDDHSHGTHTASTAAGNAGVPVAIQGRSYGAISGIAPRAYVAAYKALGPQGGVTSDLVAAIDKAVSDGVDVINYSIGGPSQDPWQDAAALALLNAREAGVFVAVSAGNAGPGASTIGSPGDAPWVTTVGAATANRMFLSTLTLTPALSTPLDSTGASMSAGVTNFSFVDAENYTDSTGANGRLCLHPFSAGTFSANQVVLCERGENARLDKSANVLAGGGGGMILANASASEGLVAETHTVPTVHVSYALGMALRQHLAANPATLISFPPGQAFLAPNPNIFPDSTADFSSRGPVFQGEQNYSKPVITAPGVDILAGYSPRHYTEFPQGEYFGMMSGTSMSSPHIAGSGALLVALHPDWTPAEIESALTTTAIYTVTKEDHFAPADVFDMGSGRVDLLKAARAGLVLNETKTGYLAANPAAGGNPSSLNTPSFTESLCLAQCAWTRTVRSTRTDSVAWTASVSAPSGVAITVEPAQFVLAPGATQSIQVTANVEGVEPDGNWRFARLTLTPASGDIPAAIFPITVKPTNSIIPARLPVITGQKSGVEAVEITAREITAMTLAVSGMVKASTHSAALVQDPTPADPYDNLTDGSVSFIVLDVPPGASRLAAETLESSAVDLDLYVGTGDAPSLATQVCASHSAADLEYCNINLPAAGKWWLLVQNWAAGATPPDTATLHYAVVNQDNGQLTAAGPLSVPARQPFTLNLSWAIPVLQPQDVYYGAVQIGSDPAHPVNVGFVNLDILYTGQAQLRLGSAAIALRAAVGGKSEQFWNIYNDGDIPLTWEAGEEAAAPLVLDLADSPAGQPTVTPIWDGVRRFTAVETSSPLAAQSTDAPDSQTVLLSVDDGAAESSIGAGGAQFIWLNRFTPPVSSYPFVLTDVQVYFTSLNSAVQLGDQFDIYVYEDLDGDGNPATNAVHLASIKDASVTQLDHYITYPLAQSILLTKPADILIGVVNRNFSASSYPAALDASSNHNRSWVGMYASGAPADPPFLPADASWGLIGSFGLQGNWMIRGVGQKCSSADELSWLSIAPLSGEIPAGGQASLSLAVDASRLGPGVYHGMLCLMTNAGNLDSPLVSVPLTLTVSQLNFLPFVNK